MMAVPISAREQQVLHWLIRGKTNREIATQLNLATDTIKNHIVHLMEKTGAPNRVVLAVRAARAAERARPCPNCGARGGSA